MRRVTATEAGRQFSELLNQVRYRGESFVITRNGEDVGLLAPVPGKLTLGELVELVGANRVGGGFAEELETIQREQGLAEDPWAC